MSTSAALSLACSDEAPAINYEPPTMFEDVSYAATPVTGSGNLVVLDRTRDRFARASHASLPLLPATPWFQAMWLNALSAKSEGAWHLLPENAFDRIEDDLAYFAPADAEFLGYAAVTPELPTPAAVAAIRLLGILADDGNLSRSHAAAVLADVLSNGDPQRRFYAAKAIWQARATEALPALRNRLQRESTESVKRIIERTIAVLE